MSVLEPAPWWSLSLTSGTVATSAQQAHLRAALERYVHGLEPGRSTLIAGPQGSGKTALVGAALSALSRPVPGRRRALVVWVSGPVLFAALSEADVDLPVAMCGRLTAALTEAVNQEFLCCLRERVRGDARGASLLTRLRLQMDAGPPLSALLELWRAVGGREGVLGGPPEEASLEVEVFWKNLLLHQITAGTRTLAVEQVEEDRRSQEVQVTLRETLERLLPSAWSLLAGGLTSLGLVAADTSPFVAVSSGFVAALFAATTLSVVSSQERSSERTATQTYNPDRTLRALPRLLPTLVAQLWRVGLAPVFVIDELDKVEGLRAQVKGLMRHLKAFVTERSAFFFVTDRPYFEQADEPIEETFFSARLYVCYLPDELYDYAAAVLVLSPTAPAAAGLARRVMAAGLLVRAGLHTAMLRRHLEQLALMLPPDVAPDEILRSSRWQDPLLLFLALEVSLERAEGGLLARLRVDRHLAQHALEVLLLPALRWQRSDPLHIDPEIVQARLQPHPPTPPEAARLYRVVEASVAFLCDPAALRGLLPPKWVELGAVLPESPLLRPDPGQPGVWLWQRDADGLLLDETRPPLRRDVPNGR